MSLLSEQSWTREYIKRLLVPHFDKSLNPENRLGVVADLEMFKKGEDPYVWAQHEGKITQHYSIFWDGEFISGFDGFTTKEKVIFDFWSGFKEAYKKGLVFISTEDQRKDYLIQQAIDQEHKKMEKERKIKEKLARSEHGELAWEVIKRLNNKKRGKKSIPTPAV